jgi:hypothetical protein
MQYSLIKVSPFSCGNGFFLNDYYVFVIQQMQKNTFKKKINQIF